MNDILKFIENSLERNYQIIDTRYDKTFLFAKHIFSQNKISKYHEIFRYYKISVDNKIIDAVIKVLGIDSGFEELVVSIHIIKRGSIQDSYNYHILNYRVFDSEEEYQDQLIMDKLRYE